MFKDQEVIQFPLINSTTPPILSVNHTSGVHYHQFHHYNNHPHNHHHHYNCEGSSPFIDNNNTLPNTPHHHHPQYPRCGEGDRDEECHNNNNNKLSCYSGGVDNNNYLNKQSGRRMHFHHHHPWGSDYYYTDNVINTNNPHNNDCHKQTEDDGDDDEENATTCFGPISISPNTNASGGFTPTRRSKSMSTPTPPPLLLPPPSKGESGESSISRKNNNGESWAQKPATCVNCGLPILARYFVRTMDKHFHNECLKCHICHGVLSHELTCFERDGKIMCKHDYLRLYQQDSSSTKKLHPSSKRKCCARCTNPINADDLVMKVREFVYHVDCFICTICQRPLSRGDHFRMQSTDLYCRLHYDMIENYKGNSSSSSDSNNNNAKSTEDENVPLSSDPVTTTTTPSSSEPGRRKVMGNNKAGGGSTTSNKRGRPPKRKLLENLNNGSTQGADLGPYFHPLKPPPNGMSSETDVGLGLGEFGPNNQMGDSSGTINGFNMSPSSSSMSHPPSHPHQLHHPHHHPHHHPQHLPHPHLIGADGSLLQVQHHQSNGKGKRMRTTFKHNQLRIMKSYFEVNPNPDTKDLKHLSQKTGLCKRVLQVWFQNARAKHRRLVGKPEPCPPGMSGPGSIMQLDDSQDCWSPSPPYQSQGPLCEAADLINNVTGSSSSL